MLLNVWDRLVLLNVLPKEGDFTTIRIVRELREMLSFGEEEHKALQFQCSGQTVRWKTDADRARDFSFGEKATEIIVTALKGLDEKKKLKEEHLSVYGKFVGG